MTTQNSTSDVPMAQRLRQLRGEATQESFAELLGISRSALANYETARTQPKPSQLRDFSRRLGISDDFLLIGTFRNEYELNRIVGGPLNLDSMRYDTPDEQTILRILRVCRPESVSEIAAMLLKEFEENRDARASADPLHISSDIARLAAIARDGNAFERGQSQAEGDASWKAFIRAARGAGGSDR